MGSGVACSSDSRRSGSTARLNESYRDGVGQDLRDVLDLTELPRREEQYLQIG